MSVRVRPADVSSDAELRLLQDRYEETELAADPDQHLYSHAEFVATLRHPSRDVLHECHVAEDDGVIVGHSFFLANLLANTHEANVRVWVPPRFGGRGVGSALAQHAESWARDHGRRTLTTEVDLDGVGADRAYDFAQRRGFTTALIEQERRLDLPTPPGWAERLAARAAARHGDYRIVTCIGRIPAAYAQGYCDVYNRLVLDAPHGELERAEATRRTPETLADQDDQLEAGGGTRYTGLALHQPSGRVVALCCVAAQPGVTHLSQWSTIVDRDHRGHRLGLAVKVATYALAERAHPDRVCVATWNAADNAPMIAVNEAMGFALHGATATLQKRLDPA